MGRGRKLGVMKYACNPSSGELETGESLGSLTSHPNLLVHSMLVGNSVSKEADSSPKE